MTVRQTDEWTDGQTDIIAIANRPTCIIAALRANKNNEK